MDTTAAAELGTAWAAGGGGVDGVAFWDGGPSGHDAYREQAYEPFSSEQRYRPPPAGLEPPYKKMRNFPSESSHILPGKRNADYREEPLGYGADLGYNESSPGFLYGRSAPGTGRSVTAGPPRVSSFEGQRYDTGFGFQQNPAYDAGGSTVASGAQNFGSPRFPQQSGSGNAGPGLETGRGKGGTRSVFFKTKLCTKFKAGTCTFDDRCSFAHSMEELREPPPGWEELVTPTAFSEQEEMVNPIAATPGGKNALQGAGRAFEGQKLHKTKLCRYFMDGNCPYGDRCNFLHGNQEKKSGMESAGNFLRGNQEKKSGMESAGNFHRGNQEKKSGMESAGNFRHGNQEKKSGMESAGFGNPAAGRGPPPMKLSYKTRLCSKWENGELCEFGDKCHFAHGFEELQRYGVGPVQPGGGASIGTLQHADMKHNLVATKSIPDSNRKDLPPSSAYSTHVGTTNKQVGAATFSQLNPKPYQNPGAAGRPLSTSQEGINGTAIDYGPWNEERKWDGGSSATTQSYAQADETFPWMAEYSLDGGYSRRHDQGGTGQYSQQKSHQQNVTFRGGSIGHYSDPNQDLSSPYGEDDGHDKYEGEVRNGQMGYFKGAYSELGYSNHQDDYGVEYGATDDWGGQV